jgi:hypothetical protein
VTVEINLEDNTMSADDRARMFVATALSLAPSPIVRVSASKKTTKSEHKQEYSPIVEVGFSENVVGRVSSSHMKHRDECVYDPHCAWCHQAGRATMELRNYRELDAIAEQKLMGLVRKGHKEACLFYLQRRQRNESLWSRIRVLLGV